MKAWVIRMATNVSNDWHGAILLLQYHPVITWHNRKRDQATKTNSTGQISHYSCNMLITQNKRICVNGRPTHTKGMCDSGNRTPSCCVTRLYRYTYTHIHILDISTNTATPTSVYLVIIFGYHHVYTSYTYIYIYIYIYEYVHYIHLCTHVEYVKFMCTLTSIMCCA